MMMNISALVIDAPAPVANEYMVQMMMHRNERAILAFGCSPRMLVALEMIR